MIPKYHFIKFMVFAFVFQVMQEITYKTDKGI